MAIAKCFCLAKTFFRDIDPFEVILDGDSGHESPVMMKHSLNIGTRDHFHKDQFFA